MGKQRRPADAWLPSHRLEGFLYARVHYLKHRYSVAFAEPMSIVFASVGIGL